MNSECSPSFRLWIVLALFAISCGGSQVTEEKDVTEELEKEEASEQERSEQEVAAADGTFGAAAVVETGEDESECLGQRSPPRGAAGRQYEQEMVTSSSKSLEEVEDEARTNLRDRICQDIECAMIEQHVTIWESNQSAGYRCAMAVIRSAQLQEWKNRVESQLGTRLEEHAHEVVKNLRASVNRDIPRVTIAEIRDHGIPGGLRSEWLHSHMQFAVDQADAHVVPRQPNWSGHGLPDRVDGVITAQIVPMRGVESRLEVSWEIEGIDRVFTAQAISFPEAVAPDIDRSTYLPSFDGLADSDQVALHFDSRAGGGLCEGQQTAVWLETEEDMHVRLLNLYGRDGGFVIYPSTTSSSSVIEGGQPVSVGEFEAMQHGDIGVERFLLIASPTEEGLGRFASVDQFCRLPSSMAADLQQGYNLPYGDDIHLYETGFRLMTGEGCEAFPLSRERRQMYEEVIDAAPSCW